MFVTTLPRAFQTASIQNSLAGETAIRSVMVCRALNKYAVAQPPERNNVGDDRDLEPWPDEEEASGLASKPNGGSSSVEGDEAVAASQGADDGPRPEDGVKFSLSKGHVAVVNTWEAPASQNQAEGFSGGPDGNSPVADCSQAPVCPAAANATGQNSHESDADPLQENTAALAGTVDQSVETDNALASGSGTSGGVESVADEDGAEYVHTGEASAVPDMLGPQTPHLQEPGDAEAGATALKEGPGWQAEASFDFHTSGGYSESSASEEEEEGEVVSTDHYLHDAFQPGLGHDDENDYTKLALQGRLRNDFAQLSLLNTAETEGSDEESSDNGTLLPVQESEEGHEGTSTLSYPSTWSPGDGVQKAESDHHADIDLRSPDALQGSLASSQGVDLIGNQDFAKQEKENDKSSSDAAPQGSTAHQVPLQSRADGIGHVNGNVHYDRQAETDLDMPLHYNDPSHVFDAALGYIICCFHSVFWACLMFLLWYRRSG